MEEQSHIVKKISFELLTHDVQQSHVLQKKCIKMLDKNLLFEMNAVLNKYVNTGETVHINKIEIDLGNISIEDLEKEFAERYLEGFVNSVKSLSTGKKPGGESLKTLSGNENILQHFFYFLREGKMLWSAQDLNFIAWQEEIIKAAHHLPIVFKNGLDNLLKENEIAAERLCLQFDDGFLIAVAAVINPEKNNNAITTPKGIHSYSATFKNIVDKKSLPVQQAIANILPDILPVTDSRKRENRDAVNEERNGSKEIEQQDSSIYIDNAGIILLHPFLQNFFEAVGIMKGNSFIDKDNRQKAAHLLQYFINNEEQIPEYKMHLNKVLCGIPAAEHINRFVVLGDNEKLEAPALLTAVISHWEILKNTSAAGLQQTFLQRRGKLTFNKTDRYWKLQVERKAVDILLDKIPWGISYIQLPWMEFPLMTEW